MTDGPRKEKDIGVTKDYAFFSFFQLIIV